MTTPQPFSEDLPRRSFAAKCLAAAMGLAALAAPTVAGLAVLLDPLRKKGKGDAGNWIRVAALDQIPADGKPHMFSVIVPEPRDKWNLYEPQPEKPVFITRTSEDADLVALSSVCPHLGCTVGYNSQENKIVCPCHNGIFEPSGEQAAGSTVSPRGLDPLEVKVDAATGDVLVDYKRFKGGIAEREEV